MNQRLLLLTKSFPFGKGEEYLEAELPHLSSEFKDLVIMPLMTTPRMERTRTVPPGVRVVNPQAGSGLPARL